MTTSEILMVVFTAVIATTGILGTIIFNNQLGAMQAQLNEMKAAREDTKRSADAAIASSDAAKSAVKLSEITAERQLRAYVSVVSGSMQLVSLVEGGFGVKVHIELKNSGQTPGYNFSTWIRKPEILSPDALPFTAPTPLSERAGASIIGPNTAVGLEWIIPIDLVTAQEVGSGEKKLFVWGGSDFIDAFGEKRAFIFRSISSTGIFNTVGNVLAIQPHKAGYEAN